MQANNTVDILEKGLNHSNNGETSQAINCFLKAIDLDNNQPLWVFAKLANLFLKQGELGKSQEFFEDIVARFPNTPAGLIGLARIARRNKEWQTCLGLWNSCFESFPTEVQSYWYVHQADAHFELGNLNKAMSIYEFCCNKDPDNVNGFIGIAKTFQQKKQWKEALAGWNICFDRFPSDIKPFWHRLKQLSLLELGQIENLKKDALSLLPPSQRKAFASILLDNNGGKEKQNLSYKHILIISYGRSGSTLLQGILNSINGVIIRGENDNVFFDFYKTYTKLIHLKEHHKNAVLPIHPWYGMSFFNKEHLLAGFRELAKGILLADQYEDSSNLTIGFKEIRYNELGDELENYLEFLTHLFPDAALIFNTRNLEDVAQSGWWKETNKDIVIQELGNLEQHFKSYATKHKNCFQIQYEEIISKGSQLAKLFEFLGAEYKEETIEAILQTPHSYKPEQEHIKKLFQNNQ